MGKKSSKAPDVVGAAREEGKISRETARDATYADRPDQNGPLGSTTWGQERVLDPATGEYVTKWTQNENLDPSLQEAAEFGKADVRKKALLSGKLQDRVNSEMGARVDFDQFGEGRAGPEASGPINGNMRGSGPIGAGINSSGRVGSGIGATTGAGGFEWDSNNRQRAEDAAYGRSTQRLDPKFEKDRQSLELRLRNRGLSSGDQQYQSEMDSFNTGRNDAYEMARMGAVGEGRQEDNQSFGQATGAYGLDRDTEQQRYDQLLSSGQNDRAADQQYFGQRLSGAENDRAANQQSFGQKLSAGENNRAANQQSYDQKTQSAANANALRDQKIQEYIDKRGFSLSEQQALDATGSAGRLSAAYGGGDSGGSDS